MDHMVRKTMTMHIREMTSRNSLRQEIEKEMDSPGLIEDCAYESIKWLEGNIKEDK